MSREALIEDLKRYRVLKSKNIEDALWEVDRANFVLPEDKQFSYADNAMPIGHGQTISQPLTVVFMLELLNAKKGNVIMDIGSGSGWQTTLLANIVGETGRIYAVEIIPELYKFGKQNVSKYPHLLERVNFFCQNAKDGLPDIAKRTGGFDGIIAAAALSKEPEEWRKQLKTGGVLVYPKDNGIYKEVKVGRNEIKSEFYPGFVFVPFVDY